MVRTVNTDSVDTSPLKNSNNGWTTIPVKPKLLVSFPKHPGDATLHMLLVNSYFPMSTDKWIWHCYLDDEILSPNPHGRERKLRIQKAFTKSGTFFAERGIVLHSLNISTSRIAELFFGSEEDLWKADALVREYSMAMTGVGDRIRRKEHTGKMVCHGVRFLEQLTGEFVGRWNLKEERLRELEDLNPVFLSNGRKMIYRIRYAHYMSSQSSNDHLWRNGSTWAITFSDFRVPECFIDGYAEFNFFTDPCAGGLSWYQESTSRSLPNPENFGRDPAPRNGGGSSSGTVASSGATATATSPGADKPIEQKLESLMLTEDAKEASKTLDLKVSVTKLEKPHNSILTDLHEKAEGMADLKLTSTEQQQKSKLHSPHNTAATASKHAPKPAVAKINTGKRQKSKPKNRPPSGDDETQFPPLPPPLSALPSPSPPPSALPFGEPTLAKTPSGALPGTLNKFSHQESSTPPTENMRPHRVKYQYAINAKRPAAKLSPADKKSAVSGSGGGSSISAPAALASVAAGQVTTTTDTIAPGVNTTTAAAAGDTPEPAAEDIPLQEVLAKRKLRTTAARKRRIERKEAAKRAIVDTQASAGMGEGGGADKKDQAAQGVVLGG